MTSSVANLTAEQYLELEEKAEFRHEYIDGFMYAMAGGTDVHSQIALAIGAELRAALRGRGCRVFQGDRRTEIAAGSAYFYADASVACGSNSEPVLIVEVLSKSTEAFDRGAKFMRYQRIPFFREYVLVSQTEPRIETFLRGDDGRWTITEHSGLDAVCRFESVGCEIALKAIYEGIEPDPQG